MDRLRQQRLSRSHYALILFFLAFSLCLYPLNVLAAPFAKDVHFIQPDKTALTLWGEGDEFHAVFETKDGYTVLFDPQQKAYFYAQRSNDGKSLVSTGVLAHETPPQKLNKHIRMDADAVASAARAKREKWDQETKQSERWNELKAKKLGDLKNLNRTDAGSSILLAPPSSTTLGAKQGLTLLIDFSDDVATVASSEIDAFLNGDSYTGFGNNGSVKKYFSDVSNGNLTYTNVLIAYVRMSQPKSYYNDTSKDCGTQGRLLINDALTILKARPDYNSTILPTLTNLSSDAYGYVAALNVFYAGGNGGVWSYGLWPHAWSLASAIPLGNGKSLWRYQVTNIGSALELGTFCHENGHMLCGYPDLYDYGYDSIGGAGKFSLMGHGGHGTNPAQVDAYLKRASGWATTIDISSISGSGTLVAAPNTGYNTFYRYQKPGVSTEYFLLENRQKTGRDATLPASGIAIWHVDELGNRDNQSMVPNTTHANYELTLVQADNLWHFQSNANSGDAYDLYYLGNTATAYGNRFDDTSSPNAHWWDGSSSALTLSGFSTSGMSMTFSVTPPVYKTLTVSKNGSGTVTSSPAGISCGSSCSGSFIKDTSVTLTATGDTNSIFTGWSGGGCSGTGTCVVNLTDNTSVTATFATTTLGEALNIPGINVTTSGNANWFPETASSHDGSSAAQSGDISDNQTSSIQFTVTGPGTLSFWWKVSSEFNWDFLKFYIDGVSQNSGISGNVDWTQVSGINIPSGSHTLRWTYSKDGSVSNGSDAGWVDEIYMLQTLEVWIEGAGSGSVLINPYAITCSTSGGCATNYNLGTLTTLLATPSGPSTFGGWSGCTSASGTTCNVTMDERKSITATFNAPNKVKILNGASYATIADAYTAANAGAAIMLAQDTFIENLSLGLNKAVILSGGWYPDFHGLTGLYSYLQGVLTIANGSMTVENLTIR